MAVARQLLKKRAEDRVGLVIGPEKVGIVDDQRDLGARAQMWAATFLAVSAGLSRGGSSPTMRERAAASPSEEASSVVHLQNRPPRGERASSR